MFPSAKIPSDTHKKSNSTFTTFEPDADTFDSVPAKKKRSLFWIDRFGSDGSEIAETPSKKKKKRALERTKRYFDEKCLVKLNFREEFPKILNEYTSEFRAKCRKQGSVNLWISLIESTQSAIELSRWLFPSELDYHRKAYKSSLSEIILSALSSYPNDHRLVSIDLKFQIDYPDEDFSLEKQAIRLRTYLHSQKFCLSICKIYLNFLCHSSVHSVKSCAKAFDECLNSFTILAEDNPNDLEMHQRDYVSIILDYAFFLHSSDYTERAISMLLALLDLNLFRPVIDLSPYELVREYRSFWNSGKSRLGEKAYIEWFKSGPNKRPYDNPAGCFIDDHSASTTARWLQTERRREDECYFAFIGDETKLEDEDRMVNFKDLRFFVFKKSLIDELCLKLLFGILIVTGNLPLTKTTLSLSVSYPELNSILTDSDQDLISQYLINPRRTLRSGEFVRSVIEQIRKSSIVSERMRKTTTVLLINLNEIHKWFDICTLQQLIDLSSFENVKELAFAHNKIASLIKSVDTNGWDLGMRSRFCLEIADRLVSDYNDKTEEVLIELISAVLSMSELLEFMRMKLENSEDLVEFRMKLLVIVSFLKEAELFDALKNQFHPNSHRLLKYADLAVRSGKLKREEFEELMRLDEMNISQNFESSLIVFVRYRDFATEHQNRSWLYWLFELANENDRARTTINYATLALDKRCSKTLNKKVFCNGLQNLFKRATTSFPHNSAIYKLYIEFCNKDFVSDKRLLDISTTNAINGCPMNKAIYKQCLLHRVNAERNDENDDILTSIVAMMFVRGVRVRTPIEELKMLINN